MSGRAMSRILYCFANKLFSVVSTLVASAFLKSFILLACICPVAGTPALKNLTRSSTNISLSTAFPPPVSILMSFRISNLCPSHGPGWISRHPPIRHSSTTQNSELGGWRGWGWRGSVTFSKEGTRSRTLRRVMVGTLAVFYQIARPVAVPTLRIDK
jgi:hypothetical protein